MGGRGRGRGPALSFSTESLGIQRGDTVFQGQVALTPTFPPLINKPVKLETDEFVINKSIELRNFFRCVKWNFFSVGVSSFYLLFVL